jgi:hypothetical protein
MTRQDVSFTEKREEPKEAPTEHRPIVHDDAVLNAGGIGGNLGVSVWLIPIPWSGADSEGRRRTRMIVAVIALSPILVQVFSLRQRTVVQQTQKHEGAMGRAVEPMLGDSSPLRFGRLFQSKPSEEGRS